MIVLNKNRLSCAVTLLIYPGHASGFIAAHNHEQKFPRSADFCYFFNYQSPTDWCAACMIFVWFVLSCPLATIYNPDEKKFPMSKRFPNEKNYWIPKKNSEDQTIAMTKIAQKIQTTKKSQGQTIPTTPKIPNDKKILKAKKIRAPKLGLLFLTTKLCHDPESRSWPQM